MTNHSPTDHQAAVGRCVRGLRDVLRQAQEEVAVALHDLDAGQPGAAVGALLAAEPLLDRAKRLHGAAVELHRLSSEAA